MIAVSFAPTFLHQLKTLPVKLQEEAVEKIVFFKNQKMHSFLRVHKLKGRLKGRLSFSVNYKIRIVFVWRTKKEAVFLAIGDHHVYDR